MKWLLLTTGINQKMKSKEILGKYNRPNFNPLVEITFEGTKCMLIAIQNATKKLHFVDEDEFLRYAIRNELDRHNIPHMLSKG